MLSGVVVLLEVTELFHTTQGGANNAKSSIIDEFGQGWEDTGPDSSQQQAGHARPSVVARPGAGLPARAIPSQNTAATEYQTVVQHNTRQQAQANSGRPSVSPGAGTVTPNQHHYHMRSGTNQYRQGVYIHKIVS
jgi:hypothetical protein